jgi:hypothetical protein
VGPRCCPFARREPGRPAAEGRVSSSNEELRGPVPDLFRRFLKRADAEDEGSDLGPKHPEFAAHFRDPIYDDEANDLAPFGNDEGWDLLVG